jgi:tetratricopeptide (TPR) repeat protein
MKNHHLGFSLLIAVAALPFCAPAFAQQTPDMLSEALALVRQVESPKGQPPPDAQKINLLKQAITEAQQAPNHRLRGHRVLAIQAIRLAIASINTGDATHQAAIYLHTADDELSTSITLAGGTPPAAGAAVTPQSAGAFTALGDAKMRQSDWTGAIAAYDQAIKLDPQNVEAYLERGSSKLMNKDRAGGMADYDQAIQLDPKNAEAYIDRGSAKQGSDTKGAIADLNQAIALDPKNKEAYQRLAGIEWMAQDNNGAIATYDQLIALDPKNGYAYGCRAMAKEGKGDLDGAIADYGQAILVEPTDSDAYHLRGKIKVTKGDLTGALADFNQAITLGRHDTDVYRERAEVKKALGDLDGALADYDQIIALDSKKDDAFVNLDEIYASRGDVKLAKRDFDGAIANYNQAITLKDEDTDLDYFAIWLAQNLQGKKSDADAQLSREMANGLGFGWFWHGNIAAFLLGQMNEADFLKAATSPDAKKTGVSQAWYYAGMKQLLSGNKSVAEDDFKKCLAASPTEERTAFFAQTELKAAGR